MATDISELYMLLAIIIYIIYQYYNDIYIYVIMILIYDGPIYSAVWYIYNIDQYINHRNCDDLNHATKIW